jgi:hypothetical protein
LANKFNRLQRCHERREEVIDAFFDLADTIATVRSSCSPLPRGSVEGM